MFTGSTAIQKIPRLVTNGHTKTGNLNAVDHFLLLGLHSFKSLWMKMNTDKKVLLSSLLTKYYNYTYSLTIKSFNGRKLSTKQKSHCQIIYQESLTVLIFP